MKKQDLENFSPFYVESAISLVCSLSETGPINLKKVNIYLFLDKLLHIYQDNISR